MPPKPFVDKLSIGQNKLSVQQVRDYLDANRISIAKASKHIGILDPSYVFKTVGGRAILVHVDKSFVVNGVVTSKQSAARTLKESKFTNVKHAKRVIKEPKGWKLDKANRKGIVSLRKMSKDEILAEERKAKAKKGEFVEARLDLWFLEEEADENGKRKYTHSNTKTIDGQECYLMKEYDVVLPADMVTHGQVTINNEREFNNLIDGLRMHPSLGDNEDCLFWAAEAESQHIFSADVRAVSDHAPNTSYDYKTAKFMHSNARRASCNDKTLTFVRNDATEYDDMYHGECTPEHHALVKETRNKNSRVDFSKLKDGQCALNAVLLSEDGDKKAYEDEDVPGKRGPKSKRKRPEECLPAGPATFEHLIEFKRQRRGKLIVINDEDTVVASYHPDMDGAKKNPQEKTLALLSSHNHLTPLNQASITKSFRWDKDSMTYKKVAEEHHKASTAFEFATRDKSRQKRTKEEHSGMAKPYFVEGEDTREQLNGMMRVMQKIVFRPERRDLQPGAKLVDGRWQGEHQKSHRIVLNSRTVKAHVYALLAADIKPARSSSSRFTLRHGDMYFNIEAGNDLPREITLMYKDEKQFELMEKVRGTVGLALLPRLMMSYYDEQVIDVLRELQPQACCKTIATYERAPEKQPIQLEFDICKSHPSMLKEIGGLMSVGPFSRFEWLDAGSPLQDKAWYLTQTYTDVPSVYFTRKIDLHYGLYLKRQKRRGDDWEAIAVLAMTEFMDLHMLNNLFKHVYGMDELDLVLRKFVFNEAIGKMRRGFNRYYKAKPYRDQAEAHAARELLGTGRVVARSDESIEANRYWEVAQSDEVALPASFELNGWAIVDGQNAKIQQLDEACAEVINDYVALEVSICCGADALKLCASEGQEGLLDTVADEVQRRFPHLFVKEGMKTHEEMGLFKRLRYPVTEKRRVPRTMKGDLLAVEDNTASFEVEDEFIVEVPGGKLDTLPIRGPLVWTTHTISSEDGFDEDPEVFSAELHGRIDECLKQNRGVLLRGPPGTGKSMGWKQYCPKESTVVFTPTHELRERVSREGLPNVMTVNSYKNVKNFADIPTADGFITVAVEASEAIPEVKANITHVVLEECFLYNDYQWRCAAAVRRHHPEVYFIGVGDPLQEFPVEERLTALTWPQRTEYYDRAAADVLASTRIWLYLDKRVCREDRMLKKQMSDSIWVAPSVKDLLSTRLWRDNVVYLEYAKDLPVREGGSHCTYLRATAMGICSAMLERAGRSYGYVVGDVLRNVGGTKGKGLMPQNSRWKIIDTTDGIHTLEKVDGHVGPLPDTKKGDKPFLTPEGHRKATATEVETTFRHTFATTTFGQQGGSQQWNCVWDLDNVHLQKDLRWRHTLYNALGRLTKVRTERNDAGEYTAGMFVFLPGKASKTITAAGYGLLQIPDVDNKELQKKINRYRSIDHAEGMPWNLWNADQHMKPKHLVERYQKQAGVCGGCCGAELVGTDWDVDRPDCTRPHLVCNMRLMCRACNASKSSAESAM